MRRHRGLLVALLVAAAALAVQYGLSHDESDRYDRYVLPAFDAYAYMAMAEHPTIFTVPPWGYRVLTPWVVRALPFDSADDAFRAVTFGGLLVAGGLLYLFLRRLGSSAWAAVLAVAAYGLSEPVAAAASYVFLADPLLLVLELLLLLALEAGAGAGVLALVAVAGTLDKEVFLLFLPAVYFVRRGVDGHRRAAARAAIAIGAAVATMVALRAWTPQLASTGAAFPGADAFWLGVYRILSAWRDWLPSALLGGLLPIAVLGALLPSARPYLRRHGYLLLVTLALPFAASVYTDDSRTVPFFAADVPRLMLLALPPLLPLVLLAVDRVRPHRVPPPPPPVFPRWANRVAATLAVVFVAAPLAVSDRYRRVDLRGPRDGRLLLALCRESLAFAQRLERGKPVAYSAEARRFSPGKSDPHLLERMRWFLREGWGPMPHYGMGNVVMQSRQASLLLPCFVPADWELVVTSSAPREIRLRAEVNGQPLGELALGTEPTKHRLAVPASALFRGDNRLTLVAADDAPEARLHELVVRPTSR